DGDATLGLGVPLVLHDAVHEGEQREVAAHADVLAGVDDGAELPHQDVAGAHELSAVALDAAPLAGRIPAVARRALSFLVSHGVPLVSLRIDPGDLDRGVLLPVSRLAAVALAAAGLEHEELGAELLADDLGRGLRAADQPGPDPYARPRPPAPHARAPQR